MNMYLLILDKLDKFIHWDMNSRVKIKTYARSMGKEIREQL